MRVMLYESNSSNHTTYENVSSVVMLEDGTYQLIMTDEEMSQTVTRTGTWDNRVVIEKAQVSA